LVGDELKYDATQHAAFHTNDYVFAQLIPYIGNKRKLLGLIDRAVKLTKLQPSRASFVDLFAGSGVVSRWAKRQGFATICNDWEPYSQAINTCHVACDQQPAFAALGGYASAIAMLNALPGKVDWVTQHLAPADDDAFDGSRERLFYMRKNAMRIDAMRSQIQQWRDANVIDDRERACLLAPLLYQACYTSNTSGVFKGFHNGWGGQTGTALYRIASDLRLRPAVFHDNGRSCAVHCQDATALAAALPRDDHAVTYIDPPYNQHPYGSNYHVLNSIALWDKPPVTPTITRGTKSAIRTDWRTARRSAYNARTTATEAYRQLLDAVGSRFIITSYSTDGMMSLDDVLTANTERGSVAIELKRYKRYRVSSQRFSHRPTTVEFALVLDTQGKTRTSAAALRERIVAADEPSPAARKAGCDPSS
jgi:adenine-specific DNA-methyltransferase